jgi:hypothetical protein
VWDSGLKGLFVYYKDVIKKNKNLGRFGGSWFLSARKSTEGLEKIGARAPGGWLGEGDGGETRELRLYGDIIAVQSRKNEFRFVSLVGATAGASGFFFLQVGAPGVWLGQCDGGAITDLSFSWGIIMMTSEKIRFLGHSGVPGFASQVKSKKRLRGSEKLQVRAPGGLVEEGGRSEIQELRLYGDIIAMGSEKYEFRFVSLVGATPQASRVFFFTSKRYWRVVVVDGVN